MNVVYMIPTPKRLAATRRTLRIGVVVTGLCVALVIGPVIGWAWSMLWALAYGWGALVAYASSSPDCNHRPAGVSALSDYRRRNRKGETYYLTICGACGQSWTGNRL